MGCGASSSAAATAPNKVTQTGSTTKTATRTTTGGSTAANAVAQAARQLTSQAGAALVRLELLDDGVALVEGKAAAAEQALGELSEVTLDQVGQQASDILSDSAVDSVVDLFNTLRRAQPGVEAAVGALVDVQGLAPRTLTGTERALVRYSALGQVVVDAAGQALSALPFGAPVAALLGALYGRTVQTAKNSRNCQRLLVQLKRCDRQLARVACAVVARKGGGQGDGVPEDVVTGFQAVTVTVRKAARVVDRFSERGCLVRFICSTGDQQDFLRLEQELHQAMQMTSFALTVELISASDPPYVDESAALRRSVCEAAGLAPSVANAHQALQVLQAKQPGRLRELLAADAPFSTQVILVEVDALAKRVEKLEVEMERQRSQLDQSHSLTLEHAGTLDKHRSTLKELQDQVQRLMDQPPQGMVPFVMRWWEQVVGRRKPYIKWADLKQKLRETMPETIAGCEADLLEEAQDLQIDLDPVMRDSGEVFLEIVLQPSIDLNRDNLITEEEIKMLQMMGLDYAMKKQKTPPEDMEHLLDCFYNGFNRDLLRLRNQAQTNLKELSMRLKASDIIASYDTQSLLRDFVPGTREWLLSRVLSWQQQQQQQQQRPSEAGGATTAPMPAAGSGSGGSSRMFLLLAEAGMGKSMVLAEVARRMAAKVDKAGSLVVVAHYFKVGQERGKGKAMLLCLVHQLCEQVVGLADLVLAALGQVPDVEALSLQVTFERLLLEPLKALDTQLQGAGVSPPSCLVLLDALDESDDANKGWQPVCSLVANSFLQLPPWVCVMVTGRPLIRQAFDQWWPEFIDNLDANNQADLATLMKARLRDHQLVAAEDVEQGAQVLLAKSKGQFIYSRYVFGTLDSKPSWTLDELAGLPEGLEAHYAGELCKLASTLTAERPHLLPLLGRLLPLLAVMREPLSAPLLAWLTDSAPEQVQELLLLLHALFPSRPTASGEQCAAPYHKSVTDYLLGGAPGGAGGIAKGGGAADMIMHVAWQTDATKAHGQFVSRLLPAALSPEMVHWRDECASQVIWGSYCLPHLLDHLTLARDWPSLHQLVRRPAGLKAVLETTGQVYKLIDALTAATAQPTAGGCTSLSAAAVVELRSVHRFLRASCNLVVSDVHALLQEAMLAPQACALRRWCTETYPVDPGPAPFWRGAVMVNTGGGGTLEAFPPGTATLIGHRGGVQCCAISAGGSKLVAGLKDATLKVYDVATGQLQVTLEGHSNPISCCALSSDGSVMVSGSQDKTIKVWDVSTGQVRHTLSGHTESVRCCDLSSDGHTLVTGSQDTTVKVWDMATGQLRCTLEGHSGWVMCCALSPDGLTLVSGSADKTLKVWDVSSGQVQHTLEGHTNEVCCCAVSPDGLTLASASADKTIKVWSLATGDLLRTLEGHQEAVRCCVYNPDEANTLVTGSQDNTLKVWDVSTGRVRGTLDGHTHWVTCCGVSRGGTLVSGSRDETIKVWDLASVQHSSTSTCHSGAVTCCALARLGTTLVSGSEDRTLKVWEVATGHLCRTLEGHTDDVLDCCVSQDGEKLVSASRDKTLKVWDLATGELRTTLEGHAAGVRCCAVTADGNTVVSGAADSTIKVWDLVTGQVRRTLEGHTDAVYCCVLSRDGHTLVTGSGDTTLKVWDMQNGQLRRTLEGHTARVLCCDLSPDGATLLSGSNDRSLRVWDVVSGQLRRTFEGHTEGVRCCAIGPDGLTAVSGACDTTVKVWGLDTGRLRSTVRVHRDMVFCCAVSPDGTTLVTGAGDATLKATKLEGLPPAVGMSHASAFYSWYKQHGLLHLNCL